MFIHFCHYLCASNQETYVMAKLQKSIDKRNALVSATISLVNNSGFHDAPMSKIAKLANVSPATIYLYFENKQDLINRVYIEVKQSFTSYAFETYREEIPVAESFEGIWRRIAAFKLQTCDKALFLAQCDTTPMIDEASRQEGLKHLQPLLDLWDRGIKEGILKPISPYLLYAYSIYPLSFLLVMQQRGVFTLNQDQIDEAFKAAWQSIKK
jgi:AcrR family transcriptional regulator